MHAIDPRVFEMITYAQQNHRANSSGSGRNLDERFVETCVEYACHFHKEAHLFLRTVTGAPEAVFISLHTQSVDPAKPNSRPDLVLNYRAYPAATRKSFIIELKVLASLTSAQKVPKYADLFLCPKTQEDKLRTELEAGTAVMSWSGLLEALNASAPATHTDLSIWTTICELGERLAQRVELRPSVPVLFDSRVAANYYTALGLFDQIIETLGHPRLKSPYVSTSDENPPMGHAGRSDTGLFFIPHFRVSPIWVGFRGLSNYFWADVAAHSYVVNGKTFELPVTEDRDRSNETHFEEELSALEWGKDESDAGKLLHLFLSEVRSFALRTSGVMLDVLELSNRNVGYLVHSETRESFYALLDARCWIQQPHLGRRGPFVFYDTDEAPVDAAQFILNGNETTEGDLKKSICSALSAKISEATNLGDL